MCTWTPSNTTTTGDTLYGPRICKQAFIDWAWDAFDFDKGNWDDGWGYDQPCSIDRPLGRTFNAIWCLTYSGGSTPSATISSSIPILKWGWRYAQENIDELDGECTKGNYWGWTVWGPFVDNYTNLYLPFFNGGVPQRAALLLHEARHADGVGHDDGDNDSSWEYNGAWRWQVCWLSWFAAEGQRSTQILRDLARQSANGILGSRFTKPPGFTV